MKRFSDFAEEEQLLDGEKLQIETVLNQEIAVTGFNVKTSKYGKNKSGKYLTLQFTMDDDDVKIVFTGSDVLINQIEKYSDEVPFITIIKKINRYYTFS